MNIIFKDKGVRWITFGWSAFLAENLILSHNRSTIIDNIGDDNYHHMYNTLSTLATASIAFGYFKYARFDSPKLWNVNKPMKVTSFIFKSLGLLGFS